ncbi:MAG: uracil-DNA glycosylase [Microvirga sp.]|nr:uracil-DNA glycosylase [Microvirga sp.]
MRPILLAEGADLDGFRRAVRTLVADGVAPDQVIWSIGGEAGLFGSASHLSQGERSSNAEGGVRVRGKVCPDGAQPLTRTAPPSRPLPLGEVSPRPLHLPRPVAALIETAVCHRDPERYALLYRLVWRVLHGERELLEIASDPLVHRLTLMAKSVRRDIHKMHAFLRFRQVEGEAERYVAFFEPEHFILEAAAPFFVERFRALDWSILTPIGSAHWDGAALSFGPPATRAEAPETDGFEAGWRGYYESTFNPARVNPELMRAHMPKKYWRNLPETAAVPGLVRSAASRVSSMLEQEPTMPTKRSPEKALEAMRDREIKSLAQLNKLLKASEPLVKGATQAVAGEGPDDAEIVFVGEQPGDQEDLQGRPFVGPAGKLFDRALGDAGLDRRQVYVTNAVKHFKFDQRGKKRIHQKPTAGEVKHYRWWLEKELELIRPKLVVALGGTAVLAMTGKNIPIIRARGPAHFPDGYDGYISVHPSYLLRLPDEDAKALAYRQFVEDLERVRAMAADHPRGRVAA